MGVWKYLKEKGIDRRITAVSGASVGAINLLMRAQNNFNRAYDVWKRLDSDVLMTPNEGCVFSSMSNEVYSEHKILNRLRALIRDPLANTAPYSQRALEKIIKENIISPELITNSKLKLYVSISRVDMSKIFDVRHLPLESEYVSINGLDIKKIVKIVMASAAIPGAYPPVKIDDDLYYDGGATDNMPLLPLVLDGYRNIIIVHLRCADDPIEIDRHEKSFEKLDLEGVNIWEIYPSNSDILGGTMELSPKLSKKRMEMGYSDASKQLPMLRTLFGNMLIPGENLDV